METSDWPQWHCPVHHSRLHESKDTLVCTHGHGYLRRDGIPRFVDQSNYADSFGVQWKKHRLTQLDSYTGTTITRERLQRCLGEKLWKALSGKQVLECGCGAGRFTEILLTEGARVTSIDLSQAVDANQDNCPQNSRHRIAQADIWHLPFQSQQFDIVLCLGVVQHTPDPEKTISRLFEHVKPGGFLVIDHYGHCLSWYTKTAPLVRRYLLRLTVEKRMSATKRLVDLFLPLHKRVRRSYLLQSLVSRISPVLSYYHVHPNLSDELAREWALLDTHDALTDWYKHFRTPRQIHHTFEALGLSEIWCQKGGNGVEARGQRPLFVEDPITEFVMHHHNRKNVGITSREPQSNEAPEHSVKCEM